MPEMEKITSNESMAAEAFSKQAPVFDKIYGPDEMIQYKRNRVRRHVLKWLSENSRILELNCGTGEDAVYFANNGHHVHATDLSTGMLQALRVKIDEYDLKSRITYEQCSFTQLDQLNECGPFDMVFSNFGGLNCTGELHKVLQSLDPLLKPGGVVTLVVISDFSLWETLLLFKGKWKTAMRRWFRKNGAEAKVEGQPFRCWYYSPNYVEKCLKTYSLLSLEGLCTLVPPSYMENFHQKHARMYQWLKKKEEKLKSSFPWNRIGDYFIITLQKPL